MPPEYSDGAPPIPSVARRHFMAVTAAGAAKLSSIAVLAALAAGKRANAMGILPPGDPNRGPGHNCFGRGTVITTAQGEVAVEDLAVGDLVMTVNGAALPVKWLGRTTLKRNASASWHPTAIPIRVARFALDDLTPRRDLYLSQEHALFLDGVLIPVRHLVNERSIAVDLRAKEAETIEYFCVELDTHQAIFAEGTAAETFRYTGGQINWDNLADYQDLYGHERKVMPAFARQYRYPGGRAHIDALLRLAASRFVDVRDPIQIAYDRIAARAMSLAA